MTSLAKTPHRIPTQNERILAVLADGREHSMREIHQRAGFMRLNSRVSELRARGYRIECRQERREFFYTLVGGGARSENADTSGAPGSATVDQATLALYAPDRPGAYREP